jgi:hypothetical protein
VDEVRGDLCKVARACIETHTIAARVWAVLPSISRYALCTSTDEVRCVMDSAMISYDDDVLYDVAPYQNTRPTVLSRLRDTYLGRAVLHPLHGVALVALVSITAMAGGMAGFLVGLTLLEALVVFAAPRSQRLRDRVDRDHVEAEQRRQSEVRLVMLNRMREEDRSEYLRLDRLAAAIRARIGDGAVSTRALDDHVRLERLLMLYMKIAVACSDSERLLGLSSSVTRHHNDVDDDELEPLVDTPRIRALRERRRAISGMRAAAAMENGESLAALRAELALISELVTLLFERTARPAGADDVDAEIDRFVGDLERNDPLVRELVELRALQPGFALND